MALHIFRRKKKREFEREEIIDEALSCKHLIYVASDSTASPSNNLRRLGVNTVVVIG